MILDNSVRRSSPVFITTRNQLLHFFGLSYPELGKVGLEFVILNKVKSHLLSSLMRLIQNPKPVVPTEVLALPDSNHGISGSNHKLAAKDATDRLCSGGLWRKRGEGALRFLRLAETGET